MATKKVKATELILDWNLWPRHEASGLDSANLRGMRESLEAGINLPPILANACDKRVVDGFHRVRAHQAVFGEDVKIKVILRVYETDGDMFHDAVKYNAKHGLPLSPRDRAHAIIKAREFRIPRSTMALILGTTEERLTEFFEKRTAKSPSGETVPLPYGAKELAGKTLTQEEMHFSKHTDGSIPIMHASMLLNALRANVKITSKGKQQLYELWKEIGRVLESMEGDWVLEGMKDD